jgi:gamma-glutamylcyclotransferase (GGCT)/AIG2-like uncharacterized protein YtfP
MGLAHRLFVYGTLMDAWMMRRLIGRVPEGREARLRGYERCRLRGRPYPGLIPIRGAVVEGVCYEG